MALESINTIVGWKEWVSLPDLDLPSIKAKIDTGATTSSLHAYKITYVKKGEKRYVRFEVHPIQHNKKIKVSCIAPLIEKRSVKSSTGELTKRPVIKTTLQIGDSLWEIELNLTNRDSMGMRMLIGREALKRVLVNPTHKFLHGKLSAKNSKRHYKDKKCK